MSFDTNWPRWIKQSALIFFKNNLSTYKIFTEGQERATFKNDGSCLDIRFDGPDTREFTKDFWRLDITINIEIACPIDRDIDHIDRIMGDVIAAMMNSICVYKYGDKIGTDDPNILVGTLIQTSVSDKRLNIDSRQYGMIAERTPKLLQAVCEAKYFMEVP